MADDDAWPCRLVEAAQGLLVELIDEAIDRTGDKAKYASPIERVMAIAMVFQQRVRFREIGFHAVHGLSEQQAREVMENYERNPAFDGQVTGCVFPQVRIEPYRVDFLVLHAHGLSGFRGIVVECDGHDFHERTKEQAARDKRRDRDLQERGYRVFRFTGSEIFGNMYDCAHTVLAAAQAQATAAVNVRTLMECGDTDGALTLMKAYW